MLQRLLPATIRSTLIVIALISIVPALVIITITGVEHARQTGEAVRNETLQKVILLGEIQTTVTESTRRLLGTLAQFPAFQGNDRPRQSAILRDVLARNPDYLNLTLTDPAGRVAASALLPAGVDLSLRKHIREALQTTDMVCGEYILGKVDDVPALPFALVVRDQRNTTTGILTATYRLTAYCSIFDGLQLPNDSILGIIDHEGRRLFFHPLKESNPLGELIKPEIWAGIRNNSENGSLLEEGSDGVRRFYTFRKLRLAPDRPPYLFLVLGIPETIALDQSRQILKRNLLLMGLVVLGTLLLAWSIGRYAYQPLLSRINHTANGIKSGNLSVRTGVARENTELERIAKTLDLMALSLEERERERAGHESALQSSLAEKETLLREIHHRVKNNLQLITSMINLQKNEVASVGDFAARLESRVRSMASVHEILYSATVAPVVDLAIHIERIAKQFETAGKGAAVIRYSAVTLPVPIDLAIPFGLILNELLTNACKYAAPGGIPSVTIDLQKNGTLARLTVSDTGPGLPEGFDPARSGGLGMQLVTHLSDQIDGQVHWSSKTGGPDGPGSSGTVCTVEFPVPADTVTPPV